MAVKFYYSETQKAILALELISDTTDVLQIHAIYVS